MWLSKGFVDRAEFSQDISHICDYAVFFTVKIDY